MKEEWEYIKKHVEYITNKNIKYSYDNYIQFTDGTYFNIDILKKMKEEYIKIEIEINKYISKNKIDKYSILGYKHMIDQFPQYKSMFDYSIPSFDFYTYIDHNLKKECNRLIIEYFNA